MSGSSLAIRVGASGFGVGGDALTQDAWLVASRDGVSGSAHIDLPPPPMDDTGWLAAVSDGVGGPGVGALGSAGWVLAAAAVQRETPELWDGLGEWVLEAHSRMRSRMRELDAPLLGASLAIAWGRGREMSWLNVGATSIVRAHGGRLDRIAAPQTRGELARRDGLPSPAAPHVPAQVLLLGRRNFLGTDHLRLDPGLDHGTTTLSPGTRLLLGTGSIALLPEKAYGRTLVSAGDPRAAAELISRAARKRFPGKDATSVIVHIGAP